MRRYHRRERARASTVASPMSRRELAVRVSAFVLMWVALWAVLLWPPR